MAHGRMILRKTGRDEKLAEYGKAYGTWALVMHHRLIAFIDKGKNVSADPNYLKSQIFPHDDQTAEDCRRYVGGLVEYGFARAYRSDGMLYLYVPKFLDNQPGIRLEREREEWPEPTKDSWVDLDLNGFVLSNVSTIVGELPSNCRQTDDTLPEERKGIQEKGSECKGVAETATQPHSNGQPPWEERKAAEDLVLVRAVNLWNEYAAKFKADRVPPIKPQSVFNGPPANPHVDPDGGN